MATTTAAPPTGDASETEDRPRKRRLYLAWGGGLDEPALMTADAIAGAYETYHYGGFEPFAHLARVKTQGNQIRVFPAVIEPVGSPRADGEGYIHNTYEILDARTRTRVERFTTRVDGRA